LRKVALGGTGLEVSRLCIGTDYSSVYGSSPLGLKILLRGFELGVNFWDTSESYGSYPAIREALKRLKRSDVIITSKSYSQNRAGVERHLDEALQGMDTDYVDIFMLHAVDSIEEFKRRGEALEFLLDAKEKGLIRSVGLSTHSAETAWALAEVPEVEVVLAVLNMEGLRIREGDVELMRSALRRLHQAGKGVYLMKVLARGRLADRAEEALRYAFNIPYVHSVSVGIRTLQELEFAVKVAEESEGGG